MRHETLRIAWCMTDTKTNYENRPTLTIHPIALRLTSDLK